MLYILRLCRWGLLAWLLFQVVSNYRLFVRLRFVSGSVVESKELMNGKVLRVVALHVIIIKKTSFLARDH
jgi:hypothetical protein